MWKEIEDNAKSPKLQTKSASEKKENIWREKKKTLFSNKKEDQTKSFCCWYAVYKFSTQSIQPLIFVSSISYEKIFVSFSLSTISVCCRTRYWFFLYFSSSSLSLVVDSILHFHLVCWFIQTPYESGEKIKTNL